MSMDSPNPKSKPLKLPSQAEIMKNPMKYLAEAVKTFQGLSQMVADNQKVILGIVDHLKASDAKVAPLVDMIEKARAAREQATANPASTPPPQGGGGTIGGILQLLPALLGGGGGSNPFQEMMMKSMFEKSMMGMDLSNALTKAMIIKLAPELADSLTKGLIKKE